jgi:excisionase family DNA binding protein
MSNIDSNATGSLFDDGLITVPEASKFLGISKSKLYEMMDAGELRYAKFGKARRIPKRALIELAQASLRGGWKVGN